MRREHAAAMEERKKVAATRIEDMRSNLSQWRDDVELECLKQQRDIEITNERKLAKLAVKREAAQSTATQEYLALLSRVAASGSVQPLAAPALAVDDIGSLQIKEEPLRGIVGEQERSVSPSVSEGGPMDISSTPSPSPQVAPSCRRGVNGNRKRKTAPNTNRRDPFSLSPDIIDHPPDKRVGSVRKTPGISPSNNDGNGDDDFAGMVSPYFTSKIIKKRKTTRKSKSPKQAEAMPVMTPSPRPRRAIARSESPEVPLAALGLPSWILPARNIPVPGLAAQSSPAPHLFGQSGQMRSFEVLRIVRISSIEFSQRWLLT